MKFINFFIFYFIIHSTLAQYDVQTVGDPNGWNTSGLWIFQKNNENVEGSVYLYENWNTTGILSTNTGVNLKIVDLNYDTISDKIVAKVSRDSIFVFDDSSVKFAVINRHHFEKINANGSSHYYEILAKSPQMQILKLNSKKLRQGKIDPLTQKKASDVFIDNSSYFVLRNNELSEIKLRIKPFCELFGEHSKDIRNFISKNNIDLKEDRNFQSILNFYITL